ncbi:MAG TPA: hypothetical protein VGD64_11865 [Acidisarcina sp.]
MAALLSVAAPLPMFAQYPGSPAKKPAQSSEQKLRSTAVLEWVGEPGKPSASRIVPIAVWDGERYQDGGLYLAKPEPLAVEDGTEYELQHAGVPQGTFVIFRPGQVNRTWFGYGMWHPATAKKASKSKPSKTPPRVVTEVDPDRPSFSNKSKSDRSSEKGDSAGTVPDSKTAPASEAKADTPDPDRPTLHKRGAGNSGNSDSASPDVASGSKGDGGGNAAAGEDPDPDRPTLHKRSGTKTAVVTAGTSERDPDRPDLHRGRPEAGDAALFASKLIGMPADLQQMAAISDATGGDEHPFVYHWADPNDALKMKAALEDLALKAIASATNGSRSVTDPAITVPRKSGGAKTATSRTTSAKRAVPKPPSVVLTDEVFNAFELSYSGGSTLVLTARAGQGSAQKDVTIIAQPDFYGVPHVLLQSVADDAHLDVTPRMRLVDAADTDGDNRAELIFELRGETDRQFAIYKVASGRAEQVFATGPMPLGTTRD